MIKPTAKQKEKIKNLKINLKAQKALLKVQIGDSNHVKMNSDLSNAGAQFLDNQSNIMIAQGLIMESLIELLGGK